MSDRPDTVFYNANVLTMDRSHPRASAVACRGEYVVAVGDNGLRVAGAREIDCQGKTLLPGFHDAHCHFLSLANSLVNLDCSPTAVNSIKDIQALITARGKAIPPGEWIVGEGYDDFRLEEKRHPNRWDLDEVSTNHPVRLNHRSRHAVVLNSKALELAGISIETPEPPGALFERSLETGEPTGLMFEMTRYLKRSPPLGEKRLMEGIKLAGERCLSLGITSLQDASSSNDFAVWRLFGQIKKDGLAGSRVTMMAGRKALPDFLKRGMATGYGDGHLRLGAVKIVLDRTTGRLFPPREELEETVIAAHRAGFQVAIHAIEQDDVDAALTAIEKALREHPLPDHRHRIEHCSLCTDPDVRRIHQAGVMVVTQPDFIYYSGDRYLARVRPDNQPFLYCVNSLLRAGIAVAAGSDTPVAPNNPLIGICAAVTRRSKTGQTVLAHEAVTVEQALAMYTSTAAYSAFEDRWKGDLSPGKLADMVLLDRDPTAVPPEELLDNRVAMTIIGGQVVWPSPPTAMP